MTDWIYGIWFVSDNKTQDFLMKLEREDGKWVLSYRFRYYDKDEPGNNPFSGKDRKSCYALTAPNDSDESRDAAVDAINKLIPLIELRYGQKSEFVLLDCAPSDPKLFIEMASRPWCHVKRAEEVQK